jgi:cytoskeletal protein RodZ
MAKSDEVLDRVFREKLENHQETPSQAAWDTLASQLDTKQATKKASSWWAIAAAITLALGAAFLFWSTGQESEIQAPLAEAQETTTEVGTTIPMTPSPSVEAEIEVPSTSSVSTPNERVQTGIKTQQQNQVDLIAEVITQTEAVPASIPVFTAEVVPSNSPQPVQSPAPALAETNAVFTPSTKEAQAEEVGTYRIRIYSDGLQKAAPKEKNLVTELGKAVGQVEGLLGKLDEGYEEIQEKKERLFSSLTSKKEASIEKQ